ncbi:hypothetical protein [Halomonas daqiaonensis]|uniref:Uncharacterized protein n=1 Tax=Halomonas daqiaonensis TaxID=650850 RepID=A0A1H7P2V6_9GAMM|nr:hypothetical protein [Halomonas daqiaonensis]SEL29565.1 hypothetical protein SAMN04488129_108157 [Halomonas daqiaonensis]
MNYQYFTSLALAMVGLLAGCSHSVQLERLAPLESGDGGMPFRMVVFEADGRLRDAHPLAPQDLIAITSTVPGGRMSVLGATAFGDEALIEQHSSAQLPVWVLKQFESMTLEVPANAIGGRADIKVCFTPELTGCAATVDLAGPAGKAERAIAAAGPLRVRIVGREAARAQPGSKVMIERKLQHDLRKRAELREDTKWLLNSVSSAPAEVRSDGTLPVPTIAPTSVLIAGRDRVAGDDNPDIEAALFRAMAGALDTAGHAVHAWHPGRSYGEQPTLWRLARCLSAVEWRVDTEPLPGERDWCEAHGIDERFHPKSDLAIWQRFTLTPGPRTWTLVDARGRSHSVPYLFGRSVEDAVRHVYARRTGHPPGRHPSYKDCTPYLVVIPREGAGPKGGSDPFFGQWPPAERAPRLDGVALLPDDVVHVSCVEPRPLPKP